MAQSFFHTTVLHHLEEVEVEYEVDNWGSSPNLFGPPESCDPGEPMELCIAGVCIDGVWHGATFLTAEEAERIELEILADPPEPPDIYDD